MTYHNTNTLYGWKERITEYRKDIGIKPMCHGYEKGSACRLAQIPATKCHTCTVFTIVDKFTVQLNSDCDTYGDIAAKCGFLITLNRRFDIECGHNSRQIPNRSRAQSVRWTCKDFRASKNRFREANHACLSCRNIRWFWQRRFWQWRRYFREWFGVFCEYPGW